MKNINLFYTIIKTKKKLQPLLTKNTHTVSQDLSSSLGAQQLYEQTIDHFGFPDVLINNAGIAISSSVSTDADFWNSSWNKTLNLNLAAPAYLSKCFINMKRNKNIHSRFRIINISSRAAFRGETEDYISYACSKGGMVSLTKTIARSFGKKDNVLAFTIAPGFVKTEIIKDSTVAIRKGLQGLKEDSGMAIIGTHCLGPSINEIFKISFDNL